MHVYYLVLIAIALMFFLFLFGLRKVFSDLSLKLIFILVFWVFLVSSFLPGLMSLMAPLPALLGAFFLIILGSHYIFTKMAAEDGEEMAPATAKVSAVPEQSKPAGESLQEEVLSPPELERQLALQVYEPASAAPDFPKELLKVPRIFLHQLERPQEQPYLLAEVIRAQRKEAALLPEKGLDVKGLIHNAFRAKDEKKFPLAVDILKAALSQTADISLKGMIYTEFVFIYKEMGKYLEAAGLIEGFLLESGSSLSHSLRHHFRKTIQYLHALDDLLKKAGHTDLSFSQVPNLIKIKAEKIYQN